MSKGVFPDVENSFFNVFCHLKPQRSATLILFVFVLCMIICNLFKPKLLIANSENAFKLCEIQPFQENFLPMQ